MHLGPPNRTHSTDGPKRRLCTRTTGIRPRVDGSGLLDVTAWRQRDSMTVHLVNLTNPMVMKGPLRETLPVGPQRVRVRLPAQTRARRVQLLTAGSSPR